MKLASSLWFLLLTAGLAVLAATNPKSHGDPASYAPSGDADAWFV